ncbi:hypothetical protein ACW0US_17535 [Xanthomonas euvesicatoria]
MPLALLELTETADGEVLEQMMVTTAADAGRQHRALGAANNRVRLFAQLDGVLPGVPPKVRLQLDEAALASLAQLGRPRRGAPRNPAIPLTALWHAGRVHELQSHSLAESLDVWLRQAGPAEDYVLIELSNPAPTAVATTERSLERFYELLRAMPARRFRTRYIPKRGASLAPETSVAAVATSIETLTPAQQIRLDAAAQREALAAQWLTAAQVSAQLGSTAENGSHRASQRRRDGELLGVYVPLPAPSYRYPTWQFREDGQPVEHLAEILAVLRDHGPFEREPDGLRRTTGWGEAEWFRSPHVLLDGATPAEMLARDPAAVLQAARTEFVDEA